MKEGSEVFITVSHCLQYTGIAIWLHGDERMGQNRHIQIQITDRVLNTIPGSGNAEMILFSDERTQNLVNQIDSCL